MAANQSNIALFPSDAMRIEAAIDNAIEVADEIIKLASEENRRLESGRPVQLDDLLERKKRLVAEFSQFFRGFNEDREAFLYASDEKFNLLQDRVQSLAHIMFENADSLNKAVNANDRRIKTIMRAIRESQGQTAAAGYGANGQQTRSTPQNVLIDRKKEV